MRILDFVPVGHKNAISRQSLAILTKMSDRQMRDAIAEVNKNDQANELIINLQDGHGYFRPAPDEDQLVEIWLRIFDSRGAESYANRDGGRRYLNRNKVKPVNELEKNQMSLFDFL